MQKPSFASKAEMSRRSFLIGVGTSLAAVAAAPRVGLAARAKAADGKRVILGKGNHTYEWVRDWAKLPDGMQLGSCHGGIVIDSRGRVILSTETENAVMIFAADGQFIKSWGKEFKGGCHGIMIRNEAGTEYLYLTHTARHEVIKVTLDGDVVWTRGYPTAPNIYASADEYKPTALAFAPNGDFYVADGYGKFWVHQYSAEGDYMKSWGGMDSEPGKLSNPHGIWVDTRFKLPVVVVADRGNQRLQRFTLDGRHIGFITDQMRLPSNMDQRDGDLVVADLAGKVTILDRDYQVVTHLGDNPNPKKRATNQIPPDQWVDGVFIS